MSTSHPLSELTPIAPGTDYFTYLLGEERLAIGTADLTRRFHEASKRVHPDRFTTKGEAQKALSVDHAEFLNRAYRTLRDPLERARYVLERHGVEARGQQVPVALAEEYFELQELAEGDFDADTDVQVRLSEIRIHLDQTHQANLTHLDGLFAAYDAPGADRPALLATMARLINDDNYARSMRRDITEKFGV